MVGNYLVQKHDRGCSTTVAELIIACLETLHASV